MPKHDHIEKHQDVLSQCHNGKPTEGVLMRFNEQEFYLLNLASRVVARKGFPSRQAWMRHVILSAVEDELANDSEFHFLIESLKEDKD